MRRAAPMDGSAPRVREPGALRACRCARRTARAGCLLDGDAEAAEGGLAGEYARATAGLRDEGPDAAESML